MEEPMRYPPAVRIREVGPRDGIQSERVDVATGDKIALIEALARAGLVRIEAASFVSPKAVPQMADAGAVFEGLDRREGVVYSALVPNRKGAELAIGFAVDAMQVFVAASDSYNLSNVNKPTKDSIADVRDVVETARGAGIPVEGTISTAFGCPFEGDVPVERVVEVTRWLVDEGIGAVSYGDTTGMGTPRRVREVVDVLRDAFPALDLNMHFHDTRGTGLANVVAALDAGVDYFDASVGGMGGSPFAAGATGNIATEDLVHMLADMEISTGVDLDALLDSARLAERVVGRALPGKLLKAGPRWVTAGPIER
jgi:hydroxymethylglutaryl-CoA lyase